MNETNDFFTFTGPAGYQGVPNYQPGAYPPGPPNQPPPPYGYAPQGPGYYPPPPQNSEQIFYYSFYFEEYLYCEQFLWGKFAQMIYP